MRRPRHCFNMGKDKRDKNQSEGGWVHTRCSGARRGGLGGASAGERRGEGSLGAHALLRYAPWGPGGGPRRGKGRCAVALLKVWF